MITGGFGTYILSITGVVILLSIADIIVPKGKTAKYIKSAMSILLILIIITPISKIKSGELGIGGIFDSDTSYTEVNFSNNLNRMKIEQMEKTTSAYLTTKGYKNITIKILYSIINNEIIIDFVHIDFTKFVSSGSGEHIQTIQKIIAYVAEYLNVPIERVFTYGAN